MTAQKAPTAGIFKLSKIRIICPVAPLYIPLVTFAAFLYSHLAVNVDAKTVMTLSRSVFSAEFLHEFCTCCFPNYLIGGARSRFWKFLNCFSFYCKEMSDSFDRERVVESMFDPVTSTIIAELEDGEKECSFLANAALVSEGDVRQRLDYLIKTGFIAERADGEKTFFSADAEKLTRLVEQNENFDSAIEGLEKMDSYLN